MFKQLKNRVNEIIKFDQREPLVKVINWAKYYNGNSESFSKSRWSSSSIGSTSSSYEIIYSANSDAVLISDSAWKSENELSDSSTETTGYGRDRRMTCDSVFVEDKGVFFNQDFPSKSFEIEAVHTLATLNLQQLCLTPYSTA